MTSSSNILGNLTEPGQTIAFCDDTDVVGVSGGRVAPALRIMCALVMPSDRYAHAVAEMKSTLDELGQVEFHATEIVNPRANSCWKRVTIKQRLETFRFLKDTLLAATDRLYYAFISKGQYERLKMEAEKYGPVGARYKAGLKRVFLRCLLERLGFAGSKTTLVLDQSKSQAAPIVENWPEGAFLTGGGPITADSALVPGLQLADMAAFSIGRYLRKREDIARDEGKPFDIIALESIAGLEGRCEHLLNPE